MKNRNITVAVLMLLLASAASAQVPFAPDSVLVMGSVHNRLSGEPEPYCSIHFLRGTDTVASTLCDAEGAFAVDRMPAGTYGLSVSLRGMTLYQADLVLGSNAELYISVITDSFQFRTLREVYVVAPKHFLAASGQLITSYDDPRLWDFNSRPCWGGDSHYGGADAGFKPGQFYAPAKGRDDDRIWQILWPDRVTPAPRKETSAADSTATP